MAKIRGIEAVTDQSRKDKGGRMIDVKRYDPRADAQEICDLDDYVVRGADYEVVLQELSQAVDRKEHWMSVASEATCRAASINEDLADAEQRNLELIDLLRDIKRYGTQSVSIGRSSIMDRIDVATGDDPGPVDQAEPSNNSVNPVVRCSFCDATDQDGSPWTGANSSWNGVLIYRFMGCKKHKHLVDACIEKIEESRHK